MVTVTVIFIEHTVGPPYFGRKHQNQSSQSQCYKVNCGKKCSDSDLSFKPFVWPTNLFFIAMISIDHTTVALFKPIIL